MVDSIRDDTVEAQLQRYRRLCSGEGYGFWEWHLCSGHFYAEGQFWRDLGYREQDIAQLHHVDRVFDLIHPSDRKMLRHAYAQHIRQQRTLIVDCRLRKASGDYIWTQSHAHVSYGDNGEVSYLSGINIDITSLKQTQEALLRSEERLSRIMDSTDDGIWEWQTGGDGIHFSSRCWEHIGYGEDDSMADGVNRYHLWRSLMYPEDLHRFDEALERYHTLGEPFDVEYRINGKDGKTHWIRARGKAEYDEQGELLRMAGINMDVTNIKLAEQRVVQAKEQAVKANQAKSEFLSSMSHELRTPLNAILGFSQLFDFDDQLSAEHRENVREIRNAGQHLLQLIDDVLDLSKIESGNMALSLEPVLVSRVLSECFTLLEAQAESQQVALTTDYHNLDDTYVHADRVRVKQVLLNLMSNAVKYNRAGGSVDISFHRKGDEWLSIAVRDTGLGIPKDKQAQLFQPFNRLGAERGQVEGTGVGLVITERLVKMMNGSISFASREGEGTTFWIDLPLAKEWKHMELNLADQASAEHEVLNISRPARVLYIEDNPSNIRLMQQFMQRYPLLELDVAEEPFVGVYKARSLHPDVIILDINLPGMDGFETLSVLQQDADTRHIPVVGLSANAMAYDIEKGKQAGFYEYLTKPLEIPRLVSVLNVLLA